MDRIAELEERIRVLEAREAIKEARANYARYATRGEFSKIADLFTVDGVFTPPGHAGLQGREAIRAFLSGMKPWQVAPLIHNEVIEIHGDEATGSCAMDMRFAPNYPDGFLGYYTDRLRKENGAWLFTARTYVFVEQAAS